MALTEKQKALLKANKGLVKTRLVTVIIPDGSTATQVFFDDQPDLRYARILGMEVFVRAANFAQGDLAQSIPLGIAPLPVAQLKNIAVNLETNDPDKWNDVYQLGENPNNTGRFRDTWLTIKNQPLVTFHRIIGESRQVAPGVKSLFEFNNTFVSWSKSYLTIINPPGAFAYAVCFQVYYTFRSINGKLILSSNGSRS